MTTTPQTEAQRLAALISATLDSQDDSYLTCSVTKCLLQQAATELLRLDSLRLELQTQLADYKEACTKAETRAVPASTGMHWTENEPVRLPASRAGRVYMAGPMTGLPELNFPAFNQEAERLRAEGLQVLNPADHGIVDGADWADYLRHDIAGLASCERIHLLRGWTKSKGACLEMTIAKALGMTVTYQFDAEMEHNNAPAVPQGWAIKFEGNDISVSNDHMGCIVPHTETVDRKMPSEVLHALCRDLLAATKSTVPAVPQGWKLVPVEPTEAMSIAGGIAWESSLADDVIGPLEDAWAAMLAATPAPAPAQEVATLPLSAEDVHAAFTKNFPKSRISQAWINFAADIAQAIAARAAKPAQEAGLTDEWAECKRISELPEVDEALRLFAEGETSEDQAVAIVQTIAQALRAKGRK